MSKPADVSTAEAWVMAARPQTLPAGMSPVIVGTGLAIYDDMFSPLPALAALVGALLIQVGTNFANDYYDAIQGADTPNREGFTRVTSGGLIAPSRVKHAMYATFGLAILVGAYLVWIGGPSIVVVGLSSIAAGIAYTGGPFPYGYRGLGDMFVFIYFGLIAVTGTYYVQAATGMTGIPAVSAPFSLIPPVAVAVALPVAGLATCILLVNNVRDRETDARAGKRTLVVILGYGPARGEFVLLTGLAYAVPVGLALSTQFTPSVLLPLLTVPFAVRITRIVMTRTDGAALNPALESTGKLLFAHSLLFAIGLAISGGKPPLPP